MDDPQRANKLLARWYFGVGMGEKAVKLCARQGFEQDEVRAMKTCLDGEELDEERSGVAAAQAA